MADETAEEQVAATFGNPTPARVRDRADGCSLAR